MATTEEYREMILVVDDTEETRYLVARTLKVAGYRVIEASTGKEALEKVQQKPDLITLDIKLPDLNGVEVCRMIKAKPESASIPVLHTSATYVQGKDQAYGLESGADGYITHPVEDIVLVATIKALLRARKAEKERELLLIKSQRDVEQLSLERELRERFVATLTHDLRSPLTAAKMSAQLILRHLNVPEPIQKQAGRIKDHIDRADRMIRDLLDVSRVRAGERLPLDLTACDLRIVVENALADLTSIHGDRFHFIADPEVVGIWDASELRRVIENLGNNAIKYGDLYRPITVSIEQDAQSVTLSVHNEGDALSTEEQASLFMPYRRSTSADAGQQKGWGLGLTLVLGATQAHGGAVTVESIPGKGTTFYVRLPRDASQTFGQMSLVKEQSSQQMTGHIQ